MERSYRIALPVFLLTLALAACASGDDQAAAPEGSFAFPVVDGFDAQELPIFYEHGLPADDDSVAQTDTIALIARVDGNRLHDAVSVRAFVGETRHVLSTTIIDGRSIAISGGSGFSNVDVATISDFSAPDLVVEVRGIDPVTFLANGGLAAITANPADVDPAEGGAPTLEIAELPVGYTVVIPPAIRTRAAPQITVRLESLDTQVETTTNDPRFELVPQADFEQVKLGDRQVWRGEAGGLLLATWEEPAGVFTWVMSHDGPRTDDVVRSTKLTDEDDWREFYQVDQPTDLLHTLSGREFEAVGYEGYPFDPAVEEPPLSIGFVDDTVIIHGMCSTVASRVTSQGSTVEPAGPGESIGTGCGGFEHVDEWQRQLAAATLTLSLNDDRLTITTSINGADVTIEMLETTFSGYS